MRCPNVVNIQDAVEGAAAVVESIAEDEVEEGDEVHIHMVVLVGRKQSDLRRKISWIWGSIWIRKSW